jgi:hypothetical protein
MIRIALVGAMLALPVTARAYDPFDDWARNTDLQHALAGLPLVQQHRVEALFQEQEQMRRNEAHQHDMDTIIMAPFPGEER